MTMGEQEKNLQRHLAALTAQLDQEQARLIEKLAKQERTVEQLRRAIEQADRFIEEMRDSE